MKRRSVLAAGSAAALLAPLAGFGGCERFSPEPRYAGGWIGADHRRGHLLRDDSADSKVSIMRRAAVVIVGAGVAGLACARALRCRGIDDVVLLELEDQAGGNARGHTMAAMACPLGAHYLPVPDHRSNPDLVEMLAELGLCRQQAGRWIYEERHLCHSPQERLFVPDPASALRGNWIDGLLPPPELLPQPERAPTEADYRRFAALVDDELASGSFAIPTWRAAWSERMQALDSISFRDWLDRERFDAPALRWYLDYCCRDDYGAGIAQASAWAGLQYFASRHGFEHGADQSDADPAGILTWPEGNAWLTQRLAQPMSSRIHGARTVLRIDESTHSVDVDTFDHRTGQRERWTARQVVVATPLFIAARLIRAASPALQAAAAKLRHAPWLVANLQLDEALRDYPGAPPSWDNVVYGSAALGYVDAMHQSTRPHPGPTVLTAYWALGGDTAAQLANARGQLLDNPWQSWAERVLGQLEPAHGDLRDKLRQVDLMRYGHAMCLPSPGTRGHPALRALLRQSGRISFAHSDLSGYSIFEEAFFHGHRVGSGLRV